MRTLTLGIVGAFLLLSWSAYGQDCRTSDSLHQYADVLDGHTMSPITTPVTARIGAFKNGKAYGVTFVHGGGVQHRSTLEMDIRAIRGSGLTVVFYNYMRGENDGKSYGLSDVQIALDDKGNLNSVQVITGNSPGELEAAPKLKQLMEAASKESFLLPQGSIVQGAQMANTLPMGSYTASGVRTAVGQGTYQGRSVVVFSIQGSVAAAQNTNSVGSITGWTLLDVATGMWSCSEQAASIDYSDNGQTGKVFSYTCSQIRF